jgi:hypothetical protein
MSNSKNREIMKTGKTITTLLMALIIGTPHMIGQTATRSASRENRETTTVKKAYTRQSTPQRTRTEQPERKVQQTQQKQQPVMRQQNTQPSYQKSSQPVHQSVSRQVERRKSVIPGPANNRTVHRDEIQKRQATARNQEAIKRQVAHQATPAKPVNISTPHNPRSNYRTPETKVYAKRNTYADKQYYGGLHYHHVYPNGRVKANYHHDTYLHNYHVLYYPAYTEIYWSRNMYRDYHSWYPNYRWRYDYGYRIQTISVFDAKYNLGEVAMVYGRVYATWHNKETDDYLLFFGGDYPNQQFTVVLPGNIARRFSWRPERFFLGEHLTTTGLITTFEGNPEIIVKNKRQLGIY